MANQPLSQSKEPRIALPAGLLFTVMPLLTLALAGAWWLLAARLGFTSSEAVSGAVGIALVGLIHTGGWMLISPWKQRLAGDWIGWWIGSQACRLLVTPVVAYLLYCRAPTDPQGLIVAVAASYFALLIAETALIARSLGAVLDRLEQHKKAPMSPIGGHSSDDSDHHDQPVS